VAFGDSQCEGETIRFTGNSAEYAGKCGPAVNTSDLTIVVNESFDNMLDLKFSNGYILQLVLLEGDLVSGKFGFAELSDTGYLSSAGVSDFSESSCHWVNMLDSSGVVTMSHCM